MLCNKYVDLKHLKKNNGGGMANPFKNYVQVKAIFVCLFDSCLGIYLVIFSISKTNKEYFYCNPAYCKPFRQIPEGWI